MEVGRLGVKFGIEPPTLIKLEMCLEEPLPPPQKGATTLDEKVSRVTSSDHVTSSDLLFALADLLDAFSLTQ